MYFNALTFHHKLDTVLFLILSCGDGFRVSLLHSHAAFFLQFANKSVLRKDGTRNITTLAPGSGANCCCNRGDDYRGNPAALRGYCPLHACFQWSLEPWDLAECGGQYIWTCWKTSLALGCLGAGSKPPLGYSKSGQPDDIEEMRREYEGKTFWCPDGCDRCCQTAGRTMGGKSKKKVYFKCMTDLEPSSTWFNDFHMGEEEYGSPARECSSKASWSSEEVGYSRDCTFTPMEIKQEPWNHERNPIYHYGLDHECKRDPYYDEEQLLEQIETKRAEQADIQRREAEERAQKEKELQAEQSRERIQRALERDIQQYIHNGHTFTLHIPTPFQGNTYQKGAGGVYRQTKAEVNGFPIWSFTNHQLQDEKANPVTYYIYKGKGSLPERYQNKRGGDNFWYVAGGEALEDGFQVDGGTLQCWDAAAATPDAAEPNTWKYWSKAYDSWRHAVDPPITCTPGADAPLAREEDGSFVASS